MSKINKEPTKKKHSQLGQPILARIGTLIGTFLIILSSLLIFQCGIDVENPTPPSSPVWIEKSLPEEWPERGIDAFEGGGIYLEWEVNPVENVVAYTIYRATWYNENDSVGDFIVLAQEEVNSKNSLEYYDSYAHERTKYSYKIKAEDNSGNFSDFSDTVSYSLQTHLNINMLNPNGQFSSLNENRMLSWQNYYVNEMENYCITLLTLDNQLILRRVLQPATYLDEGESWQIPDDIILVSGMLYKWRIDTCANYVNGIENAGSESLWATFRFIDDSGG
jgi:hypothetical protein